MNQRIRTLVAACLVATALLSAVFVLLQPELGNDPADQLAAIAAGGTGAKASAFGFALSQLPFAIAVAGLTVWLAPASPKIAVAGGTLAVLGGFGHAVFSGTMLTQVLMAGNEANRSAYAQLAGDIQSFPLVLPFMAAGLLGTVLGIVLLGVAHVRSKRSPRWIGPALWAFVLLEFLGSAISEWSSYAAAVLYLAAFTALAVTIHGSRDAAVAA